MNVFQRFIKSIYDFEAYKKMANLGAGKAVVYLLIFSLIFGAINLIIPVINFNRGIDLATEAVEEKAFDLTDGKFTIESEEMPIEFFSGGNFVYIDTSDQYIRPDTTGATNYIIITQDYMESSSAGQYQKTFYTDIPNFNFDNKGFSKLISTVKIVIPFIFIFGIIFFFPAKLLAALIMSVIGLIIFGIMNIKIKYSKIFALAIYSLTVPMLIKVFVIRVGQVDVPYFWAIYYALATVYLIMGARSFKNNIEEEKIEVLD